MKGGLQSCAGGGYAGNAYVVHKSDGQAADLLVSFGAAFRPCNPPIEIGKPRYVPAVDPDNPNRMPEAQATRPSNLEFYGELDRKGNHQNC